LFWRLMRDKRPNLTFTIVRRGFKPRLRTSIGRIKDEPTPASEQHDRKRHEEKTSGSETRPVTTEPGVKDDKRRLVDELRRLRAEVLQNATDPEALVAIVRRHTIMKTAMNTHTAKPEAFRRCMWIIDRNLTMRQLYKWKTSEQLLEFMEYISNFYYSTRTALSLTDCVDILWTLAVAGCRPPTLMAYLANKLNDKIEHLRPSEFSDTAWAFSELRIDSVLIVKQIDKIADNHTAQTWLAESKVPMDSRKGTSFYNFLPRDLAQLCMGYAQMDPAFHTYKVNWLLTNYLNNLGAHVKWQQHELLQLLKFDVNQRYISKEWELSLTGNMSKLCDEAFLMTDKPEEPYHDPLWEQVRQTLDELLWSEWFYYKNMEGYHLPFSFWLWKDSPLLLEPQGRDSYSQLDDGRTMLGHACLRYNSLDSIIGRIAVIPYYEWSEIQHQRAIKIRNVLNIMGMHHDIRLKTWHQMIDPHFHHLRYKGPRTV